ncbi:energy transducer TonB family protein [Thermocrinis sp.]
MTEKESLLEKFLYVLIALVINSILFGYLSLYLVVKDIGNKVSQTITLLLEEKPKVEEVVFGKPIRSQVQPSSQKAKDVQSSVALSSAKEKVSREESILSELEKKVASRRAQAIQGTAQVGEHLGEIKAEIGRDGVDLSKSGTRQIVYVPALPKITTTELPSPMQVRVWVEPSGRVSRVEIVKRSGVPEVDKAIAWFVRGIRFEPVRDNIIQTGIMTFRFKGG